MIQKTLFQNYLFSAYYMTDADLTFQVQIILIFMTVL